MGDIPVLEPRLPTAMPSGGGMAMHPSTGAALVTLAPAPSTGATAGAKGWLGKQKATSTSSATLGAATNWASTLITNTDASITVYLSETSPATSSDYPLAAGKDVVIPAPPSAIFVLAASGTPVLGYVAAS